MKKYVALILALVLCLSLCACGESAEDKLTAEITGGIYATKEAIVAVPSNYYDQLFLEFYKGGIGRGYTITRRYDQEEGHEVNAYSFTWRIEDEYLKIITSYGNEQTFSISASSLTDISSHKVYFFKSKNN